MPIISFSVDDNGKINNVSYDSSIKIRHFLTDYLTKYSNKVTLDTSEYTFKIGAKILNSARFLDKDLGDLIGNGEVIKLIRKNEINFSGGGITTVDVSKNITKEGEPASSGPSYRIGCRGLNIQSRCKNSNCEAYDDIIYIRIGYVNDWNLCTHLRDKVLCPSCKKMVIPLNYYFKDCHYKIDFLKEENGTYEPGSVDGYASEDKYKWFDDKESGNAKFVEMIFTVTKR